MLYEATTHKIEWIYDIVCMCTVYDRDERDCIPADKFDSKVNSLVIRVVCRCSILGILWEGAQWGSLD